MNLKYYRVSFLIPVIALSWLAASYLLKKYAWPNDLLQGLGPGAVVLGLLTLYDLFMWKWPVLCWLNTVPNLNGAYSGNIQFNRTGEDEEIDCTLTVKQTCSKIKITSSFTKEHENSTRSTSFEAFIATDEVGDQTLYFYYHNPGSCMSGDTLDAHDGMNVLRIKQDKEGTTLDGYYFTNRSPEQTKGCMKASKPN